MKIVRLQGESFKRLHAFDIAPEGGLIRVGGDNAQGKSSLLDSIMAALGGLEAAPLKPVRTGEEYAIIRADLGDVKVTRYFGADGTTTLRVENAEGFQASKPQATLDALVGRIAFDPLAFARMKPIEQAAELRRLVPLSVDLDELARADKTDAAARRDINRDAKSLKARVEAINISGIIPPMPDREAIVAELAGAGDVNTTIERRRDRREVYVRERDQADNGAFGWRDRAKALRIEADAADESAAKMEAVSAEMTAQINAWEPLPEPVDTTAVSAKLAEADRDLALLARVAERNALDVQLTAKEAESEALTTKLADRATLRSKALAEAAMPVPGLGFAAFGESDELVVSYEGEPFSQASGAQQLRVSMALAMAANPKLRVMLIKDGSLLDGKGLELVREMAASGDYQVWLESVGEGDGVGIIMEEGKVRGADEPERVEPPKRRKAREDTSDEPRNVNAPPRNDPPAEDISQDGPTLGEQRQARRKPTAMREFTTAKPSDLFGGDK